MANLDRRNEVYFDTHTFPLEKTDYWAMPPSFIALPQAVTTEFSSVYKALDIKTLDFAAIKTAPHLQEGQPLLEKEAKLLELIHDPNVPKFKGFIRDVSVYGQVRDGLAMQYIDGPSAADIIDNVRTTRQPLTPFKVSSIISPIARTLDSLYKKHGIIHRDIKAEQILIESKTGTPFLIDFGHSNKVLTAKDNWAVLCQAPETFESINNSSHRNDIYSLGVVLYETLTGEWPYGEVSPSSVENIVAILTKPPQKLHLFPHIKSAYSSSKIDLFQEIIDKTLAKEAAMRYESSVAIAETLEVLDK